MSSIDSRKNYWWKWFMAEDEETAQRIIIENLYGELEKEREASATATAEALSMISRLQGEKAMQNMEAGQYKRLVEEKTRHTEELLVIFDELLQQKETEIDSLKIQIQDYEYKLLDIVPNGNTSHTKNSENQTLNGFNSFMHETDCNELPRRNNSYPMVSTEGLSSQIDSMVETRGKLKQVITQDHSRWMPRMSSIGSHDALHTSSGCDFQEEEEIQEKMIDSSSRRSVGEASMVLSMLGNNKPQVNIPVDSCNGRERCMSFQRKLSVSDNLYDSSAEELGTEDFGLVCQDKQPNSLSDWDASCTSCLETALCKNNVTSTNALDVYEVPQEDYTVNKLHNMSLRKTDMHKDRKPVLTNCVSNAATDYSCNDDLTKNQIACSCHECGLHASGKKIIQPGLQHVWSQRIDSASPSVSFPKPDDRILRQHEDEEEQMKLLREIHEKLNTMLAHVCTQRIKKQNHQHRSPLFSLLEEAMLSFSI